MYLAGLASGRSGDYQRSQTELERARQLFEALGDTPKLLRVMGALGTLHSNRGRTAQALEQYQLVLARFEKLDDREGIATSLGNIGALHARLGEYARALEYLHSALRLQDELGNRNEIARVTGNIAGIHRILGETDLALEHFHSALAMSRLLGDRSGMARTMMGIGTVHHSMGEQALALEQYLQALDLYEQLGDRPHLAMTLSNLGSTYRSLGRNTEALEHLQSALSLYEQIGSRQGVAQATGNLGELYATEKFEGYDPAVAEQYLLQGISLAAEAGAKELAHEFHGIIARLYKKQKNWEQSHHHLERYIQLREELQSLETHKQAHQLEHRREIAQLEKQRAIERAEADAAALRAALLESQLERKQQELASTAMSLARQTEMLGRFRNDLRTIIQGNSDLADIVKGFREKLRQLPCEAIDWTRFEAEFRENYPAFGEKLIERYPALTRMEIKVCTLLRLRLTSEDIGKLICLSQRSVEWHRANARKKMGLARGEDIVEVLSGIR
jgi:tetratricopeptide (TPR) repeat protein